MITKIQTEDAGSQIIVDVTPDDLMIIARRLHLEASRALPGEEVLARVTDKITFKYNPEVTTATFANRTRLPGTSVSVRIDEQLADLVKKEDASNAPH